MRIPILAVLFALFAIPSFAQQKSVDNQSNSGSFRYIPWPEDFPVPAAPLGAATNPNPAFPLRVHLQLNEHHFNFFWSDFRGQGELVANNTTYNFRYECPDTFRTRREFQARWTKDGRKLDILLQKPDSKHTETCTLDILNHS